MFDEKEKKMRGVWEENWGGKIVEEKGRRKKVVRANETHFY